jgi:hypothetical protein
MAANLGREEVLTGPFDTPPDPDGIHPTAATMELVRGQVGALLASTPSFHSLTPQAQALLEERLAHVSAYAAECMRDICWQSRELGQIPVIREKRELLAPVAGSQKKRRAPLARAQANGFEPQAAGQIARITEQTLKAIAFPTFVADLIRGTFDAIVKTSILQMESFMEMIANVSKTVDEFMKDNVSDDNARGWLAARYPKHIQMQEGQAVPAEGADEQPPPDFERDLKLSGGAGLDESSIEDILVPAARRRLAENRLKMLSTLVLMGINRIVVTGGKIRATMAFHIDTSDRARQESASAFDFRTAAAGGANMGWWNVSASLSLSYVSSSRASSDQEINVDTDLTGEVELHFKSDYFPVQRFADMGQLKTIQGHTAAPNANPLPGGAEAAEAQFNQPPAVSNEPVKVRERSPERKERQKREEWKLAGIDEPLPAARMPEKVIPADQIHPVPKESKDEVEARQKKEKEQKEQEEAEQKLAEQKLAEQKAKDAAKSSDAKPEQQTQEPSVEQPASDTNPEEPPLPGGKREQQQPSPKRVPAGQALQLTRTAIARPRAAVANASRAWSPS